MAAQQIFLEIDPRIASDPASPYAVLPLPYERSVTFAAGTAAGPAAILAASRQIEDFDEELQRPIDVRVQTLPAPVFDGLTDEQAMENIRSIARPIIESGRFLLSLGGEHTVTWPLVTAAKAACGSIHVLHIDAHTDLRAEYRGSKLSHACVMRRVREAGAPIVHVGIRSLSREEHDYIEKEGASICWAGGMFCEDFDWVDRIVGLLAGPLYVTVDVDALDPSLVPGTGTPEPGGLTWRHLTTLLKAVFSRRTVVAADIVETIPIAGSVVSEFVAARLGEKMIMYHKHGKARHQDIRHGSS